ncbi:hypothetical protein BH24ACT26_BH24ACT26_14360 [soil metagenome]
MLCLAAERLSNAEIAERLYVSEVTVKTHINHIFAKAGVRDRARQLRMPTGSASRTRIRGNENRIHDPATPVRSMLKGPSPGGGRSVHDHGHADRHWVWGSNAVIMKSAMNRPNRGKDQPRCCTSSS